MTQQQQEQVLVTNTSLFVKNAAQTFRDLIHADLSVEPAENMQIPIVLNHGFTVVAHFSGHIQGDFLFSADEFTAAKIAGVFPENGSQLEVFNSREILADIMREALNIASHQTLPELEKIFGVLTIWPPAWIFGEYHMADFICGVGVISSKHGHIRCSLSLNLANL